ncbi:MAG: sulfite exporter TauE/SafE family protein [Ilumatobacter sp.]|uniref:sulfite exporter TauE/SafE family protein n=1 Tax=Ilumatobacter sp. TaxID=1967498 RepID=UPI002634EF47|nr:sulfite exporter TauE/SafE family protein [Ilumatobacter sp.]MDJ0768287.1 sulfite exporter TauE/SafE family protein [Ilumatobacter sp.]
MEWWEALLLILGGTAAGAINAVAGGGSTLTVPLLVLAGVPGNNANASNRVGILTSNAAAAAAFRRLGVRGLGQAIPVLAPVVVGSLVGSLLITRLTDETFERVFGLLMLPIIFLSIRPPRVRTDARAWSTPLTATVFLGVGVYGGAVQAGVGLVMLAALTRAGYDLITANNIKVVVNLVVTAVALPVFIAQGKVEWLPAVILAVGLTAGAWIGAHAAVKGGEPFIRIVMVIAALLLSGRLLGLYG